MQATNLKQTPTLHVEIPAWTPETFARHYSYLKKRQQVIRAIRAFFDTNGFDEMETPILQTAPNGLISIATGWNWPTPFPS